MKLTSHAGASGIPLTWEEEINSDIMPLPKGNQMIVDPVLKCEQILKLHGATEIYLFGSRARGASNENSDVDLAVRGIDPSKYYAVVGELLVSVDCPVDLVMLEDDTPFASHLRRKIERGWITRVG